LRVEVKSANQIHFLRAEVISVSRDNEPLKGQWYENVEIEYLDGEIEELDLEEWHELDLELIEEPEGWSDEDEDDEDWDEDEEEEEEDDEDDDWDEDEDEDDDWEDDDGRER
jgi:hypothetical protein